MVILISQNKITDFFMILAWACPFNQGSGRTNGCQLMASSLSVCSMKSQHVFVRKLIRVSLHTAISTLQASGHGLDIVFV